MNLVTAKYYTQLLWEGLLNSFSQIYFSNGKMLAILLVVVTFFDVGGGLAGVLAILATQLTALLFNFDHKNIREGTYSYNSAMVGVAIGIFYQFNFSLIVLLVISSILTFLFTVWFLNHFAAKGLPFLSIPFLLVTWLIIIGGINFSALELQEKAELTLVTFFPQLFENTTNFITTLPFADVLILYFRSLGAILFQYNDLAGVVIALGILINSRISFLLSLYGFVLGFLFYRFMEADFSHLIYSYIGFNFILTAIALGGFFIVASSRSFLLLMFVIPLIAFIISGTHGLFQIFGLPLYSLPFNIIVLTVLYALNQRGETQKLHKVYIQHFSPEKNHYKHFNTVNRFSGQTYFNISLPVMGFWRISQGYNGKITHKDDYQFALDFDVTDTENKTYKKNGYELEDYYCFNLPVIAPASGWVVAVIDGIEDNAIKDVNLQQNWGNTIVIKHGEYLFSKLSHLKNKSILVTKGEYVYKGQVIAYCGSSGRSPEPHLHFQIQKSPFVGAKTLMHPIDYFLTKTNDSLQFHSFDVPKEQVEVCNINATPLLSKAFHFIPGQEICVTTNGNETIKWEVFANSLNQTYIYCHKSKALAYFVNNGTLFYFTDYYGVNNTMLHHFYKASHKVLLGYYSGIEIYDKLLISDTFKKPLNILHDFTAPFFHYLTSNYYFSFVSIDNEHSPSEIHFTTTIKGKIMKKTIITSTYRLKITDTNEMEFSLMKKDLIFKAILCKNI